MLGLISLLLLGAPAGQASFPVTLPPPEPDTTRWVEPITIPAIAAPADGSATMCESSHVQMATALAGLTEPRGDQWFSHESGRIYSGPSEGQVRLYRAVTRQVNGCALPVIAVDRLPDADRAVGRGLGSGLLR